MCTHCLLKEMEHRIMAELDDLKAAVAANTAATTALAAEQAVFLADVAAKINSLVTAAGVDPALLVPLTAEISAQVDKLQALTAAQAAADPAPAPAA